MKEKQENLFPQRYQRTSTKAFSIYEEALAMKKEWISQFGQDEEEFKCRTKRRSDDTFRFCVFKALPG